MIAYILPLFAATAGIGASARALPHGVTDLIAPSAPIPPTCSLSAPNTYGLSIAPVDSAAPLGKRQTITQIPDGQIQAPGLECVPPSKDSKVPGTPQEFGPGCPADITQIDDGQIQAPKTPQKFEPGCPTDITQIDDGQIQAPGPGCVPPSKVGEVPKTPQKFWPGCPAGSCDVTQIIDGQIQVTGCWPKGPTAPTPEVPELTPCGVTQIEDGQIQAPKESSSGTPVTQIEDGQIQVPKEPPPGTPVTQITDGQIQARHNGDLLGVRLDNGVLTDKLGRTGYIADNRQLQFDAPAQAGAIYTAGFSACDDGTLGLGESNVFYACGSSDFNNIYDQFIYPDNCTPVHLRLRE